MSKKPSPDSVEAGRKAVQAELEAAQAAADAAAYKAASKPGDAESRDELSAAIRKKEVLEAELKGLDAVLREAQRLDGIESKKATVEAVKRRRTDALAAIDAVQPSFERVQAAIDELAVAFVELKQHGELARGAVIRTYDQHVVMAGNAYGRVEVTEYARRAMCAAVGGELDTSDITAKSREQNLEDVASLLRAARAQVEGNTKEALASLPAE